MSHEIDFYIRDLKENDFTDLNLNFGSTSVYKKPITLWDDYLKQHRAKTRLVKVIEAKEKVIGFGTLKFSSDYQDFRLKNIPEINDILIAPGDRNKGFGQAIVHALELEAKKLGHVVIGLAVGLYKDYGSAQRLYARMGYVPDGNGITYQNQFVVPGNAYPADDDLLLWLTKKNIRVKYYELQNFV